MTTLFCGIDPGKSGGFACYLPGDRLWTARNHESIEDTWELIYTLSYDYDDTFVCIEEQVPRPTRWTDKETGEEKSTTLASTSILYGDYRMIEGMLVAAGLGEKYLSVPPVTWQNGLGIKKRKKSETKTQWKNRLREIAERIFPSVKVTLYTADALLLCEYARRYKEGGLW